MRKHKNKFILESGTEPEVKRQLTDEMHGKDETKKIYLNYNATTPLAPSVVVEISKALATLWANPSSKSQSGIQAKQSIKNARDHICQMINGNDSSEVIFMSGGTEANNHVIWNGIKNFKETFGSNEMFSSKKPHIISSTIEHDSILNVLKVLEKENNVDVTYINVSKKLGCIDAQEVIEAIRDETVLISIMLANNETGIIQPITEICKKLRCINKCRSSKLPHIFVHTDAAQGIGKIKVDVQQIGVDFMTIVGHKFYGPRIGALWVRSQCPLNTMIHGGGQENGKRSGTENTCMIVGLGEAARLITENIDQYNNNFTMIGKYLKQKLEDTFGENIIFNTPSDNALPNTLNISFIGASLKGSKVLNACKHLEASLGAACHSHQGDKPSHILLAHGLPDYVARNAIRLSIGRETTREDICVIVSDLKSSVESNQIS